MSWQDGGFWTASTQRVIVNWDGGGEQNNWVQHALSVQLIREKVVPKCLITLRLPKEHHHDFNDTTFASAEGSCKKPGWRGADTLHEMRDHLHRHFTKPKSKYADYLNKVQFQFGSHNVEKHYGGKVAADFQKYKDIRVFKYERLDDDSITLQYKENISDITTLDQDEWGPWENE